MCTLIHPNVCLRYINDIVGHGLIAVEPIPAGTITWCLDPLDIHLTNEDVATLGPLYHGTLDRYTWTDRNGLRVLCWDAGRFMNHSCRPNSMSPGLSFEVAIRDIAVGEELVCDYGTLNVDDGFDCACNMPECRGHISPDDFERYADQWDEHMQSVFPNILRVPQALMSLVPPAERAQLEALCLDPRWVPSVRTHRYVPATMPIPRVARAPR